MQFLKNIRKVLQLKSATLLLSKSRKLNINSVDVIGNKSDRILLNMRQVAKSKKYGLRFRTNRIKVQRRQKFFRKLSKLFTKR